ncbi:MAG: hypothetical protein F9K47_12355 [Burkholderiales bacterium]|nr:MAG: hypothetical protein F9K47_12355 [Burkholderiales bacterium]
MSDRAAISEIQATTPEPGVPPTKKGNFGLRIVAIFGVSVILLLAGVYWAFFLRDTPVTPLSDLPNVASVKNVPGDPRATPQHTQMQAETNVESAATAKATSQTFVPTLTAADIEKPGGAAPEPVTVKAATPAMPTEPTLTPALVEAATKQLTAVLEESRDPKVWTRRPDTVVLLERVSLKETQRSAVAPQGSPVAARPAVARGASARESVRVRMGQQVYATTDLRVNSDVPGPVFLTGASDPIRGAKLRGEFVRQRDALSLQVTRVQLPGCGSGASINAKAFTPLGMEYNVATDVDHHYLERYGGTMMAALARAGQTLLTPETTITSTPSGFGTAQTTRPSNQDLGRGVVASGLGAVGQDLSSQAGQRPPTVILAEQELVGLVVVEDGDVSCIDGDVNVSRQGGQGDGNVGR